MRIVLFLITTIVLMSCRSTQSPQIYYSTAPEGQTGDCFVYEAYEYGSCAALVKRDLLSASEFANYDYVSSSDPRYKPPVRLIDLTKISLDKQITSSFKLSEYLSLSKGRYGFIAEHVFGLIEGVRNKLGVPLKITSGFRSPGYNESTPGSASLSRHMYGDGIDLKAAAATPEQIKSACQQVGASYIQLYTDGHVHCDWRNHPLDGTFSDDGVIGPTIAEISAMSVEEYAEMQREMSGEPVIEIVNGSLNFNSRLTLTASLEQQEDPEELFIEWKVSLPDGRVVSIPGTYLEVPLDQVGPYSITATVGGFAQTTKSFDIR